MKRIGTLSRDPMRKATLELFFEIGDVTPRILRAYPTEEQQGIRDSATEIARSFGRTINRGEVEDANVVNNLVDLSITLAPHITLDSMMKKAVSSADTPLSVLSPFLRTARLAELSSFGRIAEDRLKVIDRLGILKDAADTDENTRWHHVVHTTWHHSATKRQNAGGPGAQRRGTASSGPVY